MSSHTIIENSLLFVAVASCWLGVIGMLRMKEPIQALHYLTMPTSIGAIALTMNVFLCTGVTSAALKTLLIAIILLVVNSVVTHATARAFRTRELGHWEPLDGDPIEFVPKEAHK